MRQLLVILSLSFLVGCTGATERVQQQLADATETVHRLRQNLGQAERAITAASAERAKLAGALDSAHAMAVDLQETLAKPPERPLSAPLTDKRPKNNLDPTYEAGRRYMASVRGEAWPPVDEAGQLANIIAAGQESVAAIGKHLELAGPAIDSADSEAEGAAKSIKQAGIESTGTENRGTWFTQLVEGTGRTIRYVVGVVLALALLVAAFLVARRFGWLRPPRRAREEAAMYADAEDESNPVTVRELRERRRKQDPHFDNAVRRLNKTKVPT